jgi:hypothetical protein
VGLDALVVPERVVAAARREIQERCGIAGDHVLIAASHTHSGGPLFGVFPDEVADAPRLVRRLALEESVVVDPTYADWVARQTLTAVFEADRRRRPATLCVGRGHEDGVARNRRFLMKQGRAFTHPGKGNPDIAAPAGPIDPEVGVVGAWDREGRFLGCVVNYACHGTTSPWSGANADWVHFLDETVSGAMGGQGIAVFLNGACGDVTQVDNQSLRPYEGGERYARMLGARVAAEAVKVLVSADRGPLRPVAGRCRTLRIARRRPSAESLCRSRQVVAKPRASCPVRGDWDFAKERLLLNWLCRRQPTATVEVQAVQVGPAVFLANPAEYFCDLGLRIKRDSPFPFTFVVELANGIVGYVPTAEAFSATGGGYETVLTSYSNLAIEAGDRIAEACLGLARGLRPGRPPRPEMLPRPKPPWDYGVRGPETE